MMQNGVITVEELVSWAFAELSLVGLTEKGSEEPAQRTLARMVDRIGTMSVRPHPDAVAVAAAVAGLDQCDVAIEAEWNGVADWSDSHGLVAAAVQGVVAGLSRLGQGRRIERVVGLLVTQARRGEPADWQADLPEIRLVTARGKPRWFVKASLVASGGRVCEIEADGFDRQARRPKPGAYRKYEFADDPTFQIEGRLDYQLWVLALRYIHDVVSPVLVERRLSAFGRRLAPWLADEPASALSIKRLTAART